MNPRRRATATVVSTPSISIMSESLNSLAGLGVPSRRAVASKPLSPFALSHVLICTASCEVTGPPPVGPPMMTL